MTAQGLSFLKQNRTLSYLIWVGIAALGAFAFAGIALNRNEPVSAAWVVTAAICVYLIAYRFYGKFIAEKVLQLDDTRMTPAERHNDGLDYVPTNKYVVFGHHFAAIAGAGPLVGPVLAAQMGYLPGTLWILTGVVFAGAVQDLVILFCSMRRDGRSLGEMVKMEMGPVAGGIALVGALGIMIIILAALGLVVVKALGESPWGTFTVAVTIPTAMVMGVYMRSIRPGKIGEASAFGVVVLLLAIWYGQHVATDPAWGPAFTYGAPALAWAIIIYGAVASMLPVWLLLAPRDYLSTFLKIGVVLGLAIGIYLVQPELKMQAVTRFVDGTGPVFSGPLFPFLFITIACGAVSGFHSLISSGTTPKMIERESHARFVGYGGMLMESFVAIMALCAACVLDPGIYFAMNGPAAVIGNAPQRAAEVIGSWGWVITPETITQTAADVGEHTILNRAGGAPTLAVGMAQIMAQAFGGKALQAFWYHFAILFEALFILTAVDAGTRAGRFMIQDLLGHIYAPLGRTESAYSNVVATVLCVAGWGYFVYQGTIDPLGGVNTIWPLFGISNQMLAGIALLLATTILIKLKRERYAWVTLVPTAWLLVCTLTAGWMKAFSSDPRIGFFALANRYSEAASSGTLLAPAKSIAEMQRVALNNYICGTLTVMFVALVIAMAYFTIRMSLLAMRSTRPIAVETPYIQRAGGLAGAVA
jgi:carbon starvation protein CstA